MAAFFQSFQASSMPKRLLRYVLSRFELLDPESLDLDNLELNISHKTALEFNNVGIILQKLEKYLKLPPTFNLQKAKILRLRVTLPLDFYTSPIVIEIDGVDVRLRVTSKEDERRKKTKEKDDSDPVPTAADLAQSFLETQPVAEKKELEEAIVAETQDLGASVAFSDSDSDEDLTYGTGQTLALPAFLTDFLQGIIDRMQIRIKDVNFKLDVEVPMDSQSPVPELVTFHLSVDEMGVEGLTPAGKPGDGRPIIIHKEGKRHISLHNIRAFLISEANVFSSLVRSPSMPSSEASRSPTMTSSRQAPRPSSSHLEMSATSDRSDYIDDLAQSHYPLQDSEDAFNIPYDFDARGDPDLDEPQSSLSTPRASVYQDVDSRSPGLPTHSAIVEEERAPWASFSREAQSEPFLDHEEAYSSPRHSPLRSLSHHSSPSSSRSGSVSHLPEDLAQSHIYSHEDAESMYMSAFSQAQASGMRNSMPGSWEQDDPRSPESSPRSYPVQAQPVPSPTPPSPPLEASQEDLLAEALQGSLLSDSASSGSSRGSGWPTNSFHGQPEEPPVAEAPEEAPLSPSPEPPASPEPPSSPSVEEEEADESADIDQQQDDVPTPRGPPRMIKEIISMGSISVYMPSHHKHIKVVSPDLAKSSPHMPGAFSVYSTRSVTSDAPTSPELRPASDGPADKSIEIILAPTDIRFDASIGFLLAMVVSKLIEAVSGPTNGTSASAETSAKQPSPIPDIKWVVESLSLSFLEKLTGVADTAESALAPQRPDFGSDVLLRASVQNMTGSVLQRAARTESTVNVEKFSLGYANDDILSFNPQIKMYESTLSVVPQTGQDISIRLVSSADDTRCEIDTLPLHAKLDLQRLDETFGWFGGLSSFLNMGSSITSSASRSAVNSVKLSPPKPRGVRFEAPINPNDQSAAKENKLNLRINGFRLDVLGRECNVAVETSAVKLVKREEAIGVHFSKLRLTGPYIRSSGADPAVVAEVSNTRLEFLPLPKDSDLERLLELITPSKVKFDGDKDEIMVDTLLRQRKKGAVLRLTIERLGVDVGNLAQLQYLPSLGEDLARLGTVAKYLPEDDRPGLMTLGLVRNVEVNVEVGGRFGAIRGSLKDLELAHITIPSLIALSVGSIFVTRNEIEELVGTSAPTAGPAQKAPVVMMRMIDDMEPVLKVKLMGLSIEYRVPTIMDVLGLADDATPQDFETSLAASVANLGDQAHVVMKGGGVLPTTEQQKASKPIRVDIALRDCLLGLNPLGLTSKLTIAFTDSHLEATPGKNNTVSAVMSMKKASVLLIDDISLAASEDDGILSRRRPSAASSAQVLALCSKGYVDICQISSAQATIKVIKDDSGDQRVNVELRDDLLVLETCADSTQTLIALTNALKPPTPPSKEIKYRTSVIPVEDLLASITADAFGKAEGDYDFDNDFALARELGGDTGSELDFYGEDEESSQLELDSHYYEEAAVQEELFDATASSTLFDGTTAHDTHDGVLLSNFSTHDSSQADSDDLVVQDDYFGTGSVIQGTAHRWDSKTNMYNSANDRLVKQSPLRVCVRDVHIIWHLFDGYDWAHTRDVISKAVQDVEAKAYERRTRTDRRGTFDQDFEEEETVIGDFLFNSIYIGIPANRDPRELAQAINQELNDNATETESIATTTMTSATSRTATPHRPRGKRLKLNRSKHHKITFELRGVNIDLVAFPADSGETENSVDVRIHDLDIFDHVPTSTWKKFAMYDQDAGEREMDANMVHLEILNTKPVADVAASEMVIKVKVLPLRLHVDQDALDFITRFFEFKDDSTPIHASPSDVPFIQRIEIHDIPVALDFKPKRVDYAGLRSGHTTEFMNFMILEDSRMVLRHVILYGVSGFDKMGKELNSIWMDNVKRTQLPGILAGLAPVRSLVNAGSGFKDLVEIPIREYRKDGRIVRSIGKGVGAFAKTTGTEVVKLGAKLAIGTQYALQGAEGILVKGSGAHGEGSSTAGEFGDDDEFPEERKQISLYAEQPMGIIQGVRGAYASLARDLSVARDAIIAVPAEIMESSSAQGAAKAVLKRAPTIIFRPAIGATKAIGQTLLGATNSLDPENRRRMEAKYKKH